MAKILEDVTIETLPEAIRQGNIQPGQRFAIVIESDNPAGRSKLADIAAKMRVSAAKRGLTTEIFDDILARN